jgi:hypothetical protein
MRGSGDPTGGPDLVIEQLARHLRLGLARFVQVPRRLSMREKEIQAGRLA